MSIALSTHKVAAAAVGVAMIFSFALVTPAKAQTVEELTAQINSLLATIASLQSQLAGISGGSTSTGTGCYNFTLNHEIGDQGGEVMDIQKFLNANGYTVSVSGAGSAGNESSYFGAKTKAAVIAFQNANAASILAPVGLSAGTGYWGPSSRSHANSMCTGTGTGTGTGTTVPTGTGVTVAAAAQPGNALAVEGATRVPYTKFTLTNNSGSVQTINSIVVERTGIASDDAFDGIVLIDQNGTQIGNSRVLSSNHRATVGEAFTLQPGETRTLTIAGNLESDLDSYAGEVASLSLVAVNTSATVSGSLPITGAAHTVNATLSVGSLTVQRGVEDPGADDTKEIGTTGYRFTALKLTAGSAEDVRLHSIRFDQSGSASAADIANVKVEVDGTTYTPTVSGDYYTVNFGSGIVIEEGLSKEVVVKGDIAGGTNRTIAFDIRKNTDIYATGETYGYGVKADDGNTTTEGTEGTYDDESTPTYDAYDVTISGGTFNSVSKSNAAPAANIAKQKAEELLGAFTVDLKGEAITVQTLNFDATVDAGATERKLTNVTLVDQNGTVLAGPVDSTTAWGTSATTVANALTFSNVSFPTGATTVYVKGQLNSYWAANDTLALSTQPSTDWSDATGDTTGDTVTLPSSTATANTMTIKAATFTATTLTEPAARSIVAGATDFVFATFSIDAANSGEDVRVTAVAIEDTASSTSGAVDIDNVEIWANLSGGSTGDSVRGDKYETRVADAEQLTGTTNGDNAQSITLDQHVTVAKNSSVEFAIVADLASGAFATDSHTISLDTDENDVTAVGVTSGSTITGVTPSGAGQTMTVSGGGTLTVTIDSSSPSASLLLDDTATEQTVAVLRLAANNVEDLDVDSIKLTDVGTTTNSGEPVSKYVFYNGSTKLGEAIPTSGAAEVFLTDGTLTVPADGNVKVTVKAVVNNVTANGVNNNDTLRVGILASGDVETTGKDSGSAVDSTATATYANIHTIYEAYPVFAFDNSGVSTTLVGSTNHLIAKIKVTNPGNEDVTFFSSASNDLTLQVTSFTSDDDDAAVEGITLKDGDGNVLDSNETYNSTTTTEVVFDFDGAYSADFTVPAGGTEYLYVYADTSDHEADGDTIQAWFDDTAGDLKFSVDGTGNFSEGDYVFKGDLFGPAHINPS